MNHSHIGGDNVKWQRHCGEQFHSFLENKTYN